MTRRRSTFAGPRERQADSSPRITARSLGMEVLRLAALQAGAEPRHDHDTIERRQAVVREWIAAMRAVGLCKRCGERLDGTSPEAELARERGVGATCWSRLTDDERTAITAWVEQQRERRAASSTEPDLGLEEPA